ncbi:hypothetical protein WICPIJ_007912 [Wickerhamomyces pijperi]|uniref:Protein MEMO1 n=1 Tax=Wickerhamomyces pijperi TaxID=599730 RepID=A0A9P8PYZ1_WICPI|nr:hypothetical protein WICPIJ_007912 [Wickerhamomyces pijperi]
MISMGSVDDILISKQRKKGSWRIGSKLGNTVYALNPLRVVSFVNVFWRSNDDDLIEKIKRDAFLTKHSNLITCSQNRAQFHKVIQRPSINNTKPQTCPSLSSDLPPSTSETMVTVSRSATHSGSWYSSDPDRLSKQIERFLTEASTGTVKGARILIGPHAGYSYAGKTLAETFKVWDTSNVGVDYYETPFGEIPVDKDTIHDLTKHHRSIFKIMDLETDEDEHSFEMHAPYIYKMCQDLPQGIPSIIPLMISHTDDKFNEKICEVLAEYFQSPENHFIISSDFCHWGSRFGYTKYSATGKLEDLGTISHHTSKQLGKDTAFPIYSSIEMLDKYAMKVASTGSSRSWRDYIKLTGNTICGQRPILLVLKTIEISNRKVNDTGSGSEAETDSSRQGKFKWIGYTQSSKVLSPSESSVSYASGYVVA